MNFFNKVKNIATDIVSQDEFSGSQLKVNGTVIQVGRQIASGSFAYIYDTSNPDFVVKHMRI